MFAWVPAARARRSTAALDGGAQSTAAAAPHPPNPKQTKRYNRCLQELGGCTIARLTPQCCEKFRRAGKSFWFGEDCFEWREKNTALLV